MGESVEEAFKRWEQAQSVGKGLSGTDVERLRNYSADLRAAFFAGFRAGFSSPAPTRPEQVRLENELDEFERGK